MSDGIQDLSGAWKLRAWDFVGVESLETQSIPSEIFPENIADMSAQELKEAAQRIDSAIHEGNLKTTFGPTAIIESPDGLKKEYFPSPESVSEALSKGSADKHQALSEALRALTVPAPQQARAPALTMTGTG